jgi:hypothetical protein
VVDGEKIDICPGHIAIDKTVMGLKNWAQSIFTSPSIYYSSNPVYSKEVITNDKRTWFPIVEAALQPKSFTEHESTTPSHLAIPG